jgi:catechol 2,3-dioxygenase-like lactoylglutathione lyase family enzyme
LSHGLDLGPIARVELACRDLPRQRDFYARILGLPAERGNEARFRIGQLELVLRPRGDALFPRAGEARTSEVGALLAFPVLPHELDRWYRRMLTARVAVLEAPGPAGAPPRVLRVADSEGNVVELFAQS